MLAVLGRKKVEGERPELATADEAVPRSEGMAAQPA